MAPLINLLILIAIYACIVWGAFYICDRAGAPQPIRWIVGLILLIGLLYAFFGSGYGIGTIQLR